MTDPQSHIRKPTKRQLAYLRHLAETTGGTFVSPQTRAEASREITKLKNRKRTSRADRRRERLKVRRDMAAGPGDAARVRAEELDGYGATAGWSTALPEEEDEE
jgi:hypothetical protein